jgi:hypothetical protein
MTENGKQLRVKLTEADMAAFREAKVKAEAAAGVALTDAQFAVGIIRKAIGVAAG